MKNIESIFSEHSPGLLAYLKSQVKSQEDAEDLLQDVFYQLARNSASDSASGIGRVSAWLYSVARNSVINFWRKKREISVASFFDSEDEVCADIAQSLRCSHLDSPDSMYLRKLIWQELEIALEELPPEQSEVFCLTVFDGMPVKDISAATGTPVATLLSRKHYAVKFLRKRFHELYDELLIEQ